MQPFIGIAHMLSYPFMVRAFIAGGCIAVTSGFVGYFLVMRNQIFSGDALGHVAFTGALAALAFGVNLQLGLYAGCIAVAILMAVIAKQGIADDVVIGNVFSFVLGLGVLFLTIYTTRPDSSSDSTAGVQVLFGSILGLSNGQTITNVFIAAGVFAIMVVLGRPLLFSSIDGAVAQAQGISVKFLGVAFLILVGVTAGQATQAVGALLLLGLLATPAGAAQRLTNRPYVALALSSAISLASVWIGLCLSYAVPVLPPSFAILALTTAFYLASWGLTTLRDTRIRTVSSTHHGVHFG